jgi:hypothetical protein
MNQEKKVVKISDVVQNQIPEFILSENPNFVEFFKQYYISQEFQGSTIDLAENLIEYKNVDSFDATNLISETTLTSSVEFFDDVINVSSTNGWPDQYGLLKIDDEIITYTGITSTSFTGCIRGFSGTSSLTQENNPEFLVFSQTDAASHTSQSIVYNLSNLFLREFFRKVKYQFTPGFEELNFASDINVQNFISKAKSFYQTKGTDEAYKILFKVLYAQDAKVLKPDDYCFTPSDDKWRVVETFVCELISGNPTKTIGQTLYQNDFPQYNINDANGSIYDVESFTENNETFYKLRIFSGYSNNLNPKGSIQGTFVPTPKTFVVEDISSGSTVITVDSTVGFRLTGSLEIAGQTIKYTDKTNNQFLNCTPVTTAISKKSKVFSDHYVYSYENETNNIVIFKLCNVLSKLESSNVLYAYDFDPVQIEHFGSVDNSVFSNSLIYNIPVSVSCGMGVTALTTQIRNNQKEAFSINTGNVLTKYPHTLKTGDIVDIYLQDISDLTPNQNNNLPVASNIPVNVLYENEFTVSTIAISQQLASSTNAGVVKILKNNINNLVGKDILVRRRIKKSPYQNLNLTANIQDSYVDSDNYYITTNGLAEYPVSPLDLKKSFYVNINYYIDTVGSHYFANGDAVTVVEYNNTPGFKNIIGIDTGKTYYTTVVNNFQVHLSQSRSDVGISSYVPFIEYNSKGVETGRVSNITLIPSSQYGNTFNSSKLFKKFSKSPVVSKTKEKTLPGNIGVFVNGLELRNYKSFDKIYYGPIESISILDSGIGYDLYNPPKFSVSYDNTEYNINTTIIPELKGKLIKLAVTDPGYDYVETPTINILGGNNNTVATQVKMKNVTNQVTFNASTKDTVVSTVSNTFIFKTPHRFAVGEPIIYKTLDTNPIGIGSVSIDGYLINNSVYYASQVGVGTSMRLAYNKSDAVNGTNLIDLRTNGGGIQQFISTIPRKGIDEVIITKNENEFQYKKLSFISSDVNLLDDIITISNHGFSTGEEVIYTWNPVYGFNGASIGGLTSGVSYYIVKIDDNKFRLSSTKNYITYTNLTSTENYTTYFLKYPPVKVQILGTITATGISTIGYNATISPQVLGHVVDAKVQKNPPNFTDNFGDKFILNYEKDPAITVIEGDGAYLTPIIVNGTISQVVVSGTGTGYFNSIDLVIKGSGFGAQLEPIISQGSVVDVKIINGGVGYASTNTTIEIVSIGKNLKLKSNLNSWTVNDVNRYGISNIEDGLVFGKNYSLIGNTYGIYFLNTKLRNFLNITQTNHSPIVGWAYDGCPIYGPYGYKNIDGTGGISRMVSGYTRTKDIGSIYDLAEEYTFTNTGTLDEHNGRFCITPEFPNGIYAYFCTLNASNIPVFPYVIGDTYNYTTPKENFDLRYNQTLDFNGLDITKYTNPYRVNDNNYRYEYFEFFRNSNGNDIIIEKSSEGTIDKIDIIDSGINYKVGDSIIFDNEGTLGFGVIANVSEIGGSEITAINTESSTLSNITFISDGKVVTGIASTYHSLENNFYVNITGISTDSYKNIEGFRQISIPSTKTRLSVNLASEAVTGIITSIQVNESIFLFDVDSQIKINNEIVKVIGLDYQNNFINVLRPLGSPAHSTTETVELLQTKFNFYSPKPIAAYSKVNQSYYFDPTQSVSIGTNTLVGAGNTLTIPPLGIGISYTKYVPTAGIYLPNNKFVTGDQLTYIPDTSSIVTNYGNLDSLSNLFVVKIEEDVIGIVINKNDIGDSSKLLTYTAVGTGSLHKFTTNRNIISGTITKNDCTVSVAATHGLIAKDLVNLNVISGITTTFVVTYSGNRLLINSQNNPQIDVYNYDQVIFDLSSGTLSGIDFNLYTDENFQNKYIGNSINGIEVIKSSSQLILNTSKNTPKTLYYNLTSNSSTVLTDISVLNYNQLRINDSLYNANVLINTTTDYTFTFNLKNTPERLSYNSTSQLSYTVLKSNTAIGPILNVELISKGFGYKKLPSIVSVNSQSGVGANLFADSYTIGAILTSRVNNTKFICPSDITLKPTSKVFSTLKLTDNYTVDKLDILSKGQNYVTAPKINLYNFKENKIISNFSASATLKNSSIDEIVITNPGFGLNSNDTQIIVTNNNNGLEILNASVAGTSPYEITLTLRTPISGFSTSNPLPIKIGDKVFVEGIKGSGSGFNSTDYQYQPFTITYVDPAYGSQDAAIIRYELDTNPGSFDSNLTYSAFAIPYEYIPKITAVLKQNVFYNKEIVSSAEIIDNTYNSPITNVIKVKNSNSIKLNDVILGKTSGSAGKVFELANFNSNFYTNSSVPEIIGGQENRGYLSSNIQKLSDNNYYQKFSYSLKSNKSFEDWNSPVSDLTHVSGYKKFSDLQVESVGIGTTQSIKTDSSSTLNVILNSYVDVNSINDYDLVREEDIEDTNGAYTQYLTFNSLKLGNSLKSTNNRVLSIDDISQLFRNQPTIPKVILDSNANDVLKYEFYLTEKNSLAGKFVYPEIFEIFITRDLNDVNLVSYSYFYDYENLQKNSIFGEFSAEINPIDNSISLYFIPTNSFSTIDIKAIKETAPNLVGIATTSFGYTKSVDICQTYDGVQTSTPQVLYSIPISDCKSGTLLVGISSSQHAIENSFELSFVKTTDNVNLNFYSENIIKDLGQIAINTNGLNIEFVYTGISGIGATVQCNLKLLTNTYAGYDTITKTVSKFSSYEVISNSNSIGISTVSGLYGFTKYILEIEQTVGLTTQRSIVQLNSIHAGDYLNNTTYDLNGDISISDLNFQTDYSIFDNNYTLYFNPVTSANYSIKVYESSLLSPNQ